MCPISPGVPTDSGGADGSAYAIEPLYECNALFKLAALAGEEAEAKASLTDEEVGCALSLSKVIIFGLRDGAE